MKIEEAKFKIQNQLTKQRYEHTLRVVQEAVKLAQLYQVPIEKAELAAMLHDYAKNHPVDLLKKMVVNSTLPKDLLDFDQELWHGPVGAILVEQELGIEDKDIKGAIRYHTTGKANMNALELIVFVADYIEPGRNFPGITEVREMAYQNLIHAAWMASRNTIQFLISKKAPIYPDTFHAYNDLTRKLDVRA